MLGCIWGYCDEDYFWGFLKELGNFLCFVDNSGDVEKEGWVNIGRIIGKGCRGVGFLLRYVWL